MNSASAAAFSRIPWRRTLVSACECASFVGQDHAFARRSADNELQAVVEDPV